MEWEFAAVRLTENKAGVEEIFAKWGMWWEFCGMPKCEMIWSLEWADNNKK